MNKAAGENQPNELQLLVTNQGPVAKSTMNKSEGVSRSGIYKND